MLRWCHAPLHCCCCYCCSSTTAAACVYVCAENVHVCAGTVAKHGYLSSLLSAAAGCAALHHARGSLLGRSLGAVIASLLLLLLLLVQQRVSVCGHSGPEALMLHSVLH